MRDKYGVASDKYCYSGSDVLINLLNIRDPDILSEAEAEFTAERYRTYNPSQNTISDFTLYHLKHLHLHLFQDLYDWAGKTRDVDISKGETRFCTWTRIEPEAQKLFKTIPDLAQCKNYNELIEKVADLFVSLICFTRFEKGMVECLGSFLRRCYIRLVMTLHGLEYLAKTG